MGCFTGCFGSEKDLNRRKHKINPQSQRNKVENVDQESSVVTGEHGITGGNEKQSYLVSELGNKCEGDGGLIPSPSRSPSLSPRKRVTFDTNVTTYEHVLVSESVGSLPDHNTNFGNANEEGLRRLSTEDDDSVITTVGGLYPPNHRYHNARDSDDEYDSYGESDIDDDDLDELDDEEDEEDNEAFGLETNLVLSPVENITQWKAAKLKGTVIPLKPPQKENSNTNFEATFKNSPNSLKSKSDQVKCVNQEITAIDASLSNWLVSPEIMKYKKKTCIEDRPILGALTVKELSHNSIYLSPRKSPSRSPDEKPIIGTVGTYWSNLDSAKRYNSVPSFI